LHTNRLHIIETEEKCGRSLYLKVLSETVEDNGIPGRESIPGLLEYGVGC
jgi:hypothetical protein